MDAGFGPEDEYNTYSKPLFERGESAAGSSIYRPRKGDGDVYGDADAQFAKLSDTSRLGQHLQLFFKMTLFEVSFPLSIDLSRTKASKGRRVGLGPDLEMPLYSSREDPQMQLEIVGVAAVEGTAGYS